MLASFTLKRQQPQPQTLIYCTYHRIQLLLGMSFIFLCFWGALPASLVALGMYGVIEGSRCCSKVRENRRGHLLTASISLRERQTAHLEWQASQGICKWILRAPELSVVSIGGDVAVGTATQRAPRFIPAGAVPHRAVTSVYIPPHCQWLHVCSVCVLQLW